MSADWVPVSCELSNKIRQHCAIPVETPEPVGGDVFRVSTAYDAEPVLFDYVSDFGCWHVATEEAVARWA